MISAPTIPRIHVRDLSPGDVIRERHIHGTVLRVAREPWLDCLCVVTIDTERGRRVLLLHPYRRIGVE